MLICNLYVAYCLSFLWVFDYICVHVISLSAYVLLIIIFLLLPSFQPGPPRGRGGHPKIPKEREGAHRLVRHGRYGMQCSGVWCVMGMVLIMVSSAW
ncbi:hypothetical protein EON63_03800 [archaeon]|nr:MAG: hypothetical protein EON63_03800 [archaeon]